MPMMNKFGKKLSTAIVRILILCVFREISELISLKAFITVMVTTCSISPQNPIPNQGNWCFIITAEPASISRFTSIGVSFTTCRYVCTAAL